MIVEKKKTPSSVNLRMDILRGSDIGNYYPFILQMWDQRPREGRKEGYAHLIARVAGTVRAQ